MGLMTDSAGNLQSLCALTDHSYALAVTYELRESAANYSSGIRHQASERFRAPSLIGPVRRTVVRFTRGSMPPGTLAVRCWGLRFTIYDLIWGYRIRDPDT